MFAALLGLMPDACAKVLGRGEKPAPTEAPPPVPSTPVTTPPTYPLPEPPGPAPTSAPPPGTPSPELQKAREAQDKKDYKKVKALLEKKVKAGKANREEAQLLMDACGNLKDRACVDLVRKTHPEIEGI